MVRENKAMRNFMAVPSDYAWIKREANRYEETHTVGPLSHTRVWSKTEYPLGDVLIAFGVGGMIGALVMWLLL